MKIEVSYKDCTVTITEPDQRARHEQLSTDDPTLYPGLRDLVNPSPSDVVNHVLENPPRVQWVLENPADKETHGVSKRLTVENA